MFKILIALSLCVFSYANEPSVYGAGDLNSPSPYGLNDLEKLTIKNKKELKRIEKLNISLNSKLNQISESISGTKSLIEGLVNSNRKIQLKINNFEKDLKYIKNKKYDSKIKLIEDNFALFVKEQNQNINKLNNFFKEISLVIDTINTNYISKDSIEVLSAEIQNIKSLVIKEIDNIKEKSIPKNNNKTKEQAISFFKKANYRKAIKYFEYLLKNNYQPARSNYYIAESYYYLKDYKNAIHHYKQSSKLYDKASYIPILMLHTGISFKKIAEDENSRKFLKALVKNYPNTKEAKLASKALKLK